jgi:hypothetical protein
MKTALFRELAVQQRKSPVMSAIQKPAGQSAALAIGCVGYGGARTGHDGADR